MNDANSLSLHRLPAEASDLVKGLEVHPYLLAHLILVHDAASRLVEGIGRKWPHLSLDVGLVCWGAAIHDIGKVEHPEEMTGPGREHHQAGVSILKVQGIDDGRARFASTHGAWKGQDGLPLEDLLVSLADVIWAGGRSKELEDRITELLAASDRRELWQTFMDLDDLLTEIAADGERRLVWQTQFAPDKDKSALGSLFSQKSLFSQS